MLKPGIYRLTEDTANPMKVDRRRTGPWDTVEFEKGTAFVVSYANDICEGNLPRLGLRTTVDTWSYKHFNRVADLLAALEPRLEKVDRMASLTTLLLHYREVEAGVGSYVAIVEKLIQEGILDLPKLDQLLRTINKLP